MKKIISVMLSILMLATSLAGCISAFAQDGFTVSFDKEKQMIVVDGTGDFNEMRIYEQFADEFDGLISVSFSDGITSIGEDVMAGCENLSEIYLPESIKTIKKGGFSDCDSLKTVYYAGTKEQYKQIRIEREGNEDYRDANTKYGKVEKVNHAPLYACLAVFFVACVCLTFVSTKKARKK